MKRGTGRKFAIAGTAASGGTVYWTGEKVRAWTPTERWAKTWAKRVTAERWLHTPVGPATDLRVLEVAP